MEPDQGLRKLQEGTPAARGSGSILKSHLLVTEKEKEKRASTFRASCSETSNAVGGVGGAKALCRRDLAEGVRPACPCAFSTEPGTHAPSLGPSVSSSFLFISSSG